MIYKATELIKQEFEHREYPYTVKEVDNISAVLAEFDIKNGPNVCVQFQSIDNDNDVTIRSYGLVKNVTDDKVDIILRLINEYNRHYRYLKFFWDKEDREVNLAYDLPSKITDASVGTSAWEIFVRVYQITSEVYQEFMREIIN
jgi:hypothetical protein